MRTIDVQTYKQELDEGKVPVTVDVRNPDEYEAGHIPGVVHLPLAAVPARFGEVLSEYKDGPVYVVCQRGGRSARACMFLESQGYDVVNVMGGTGGWIAAGHEVE